MSSTTVPPRKAGLRRWQWVLLAFVILFLAAFLLGYIPEFRKVNGLTTELKSAQQNQRQMAAQLQLEGIRNQFSHAYLEATRNNFGLASQQATKGFDLVASASSNAVDESLKATLLDISGQRSTVMAGLAKADPNARNQLAAILDELDKGSGS